MNAEILGAVDQFHYILQALENRLEEMNSTVIFNLYISILTIVILF